MLRMFRSLLLIFFIGLSSYFLFSCAGRKVKIEVPEEKPAPQRKVEIRVLKEVPHIRVLIGEPSKRVRISVNGSFFVGRDFRDESLRRYDNGGRYAVRMSGGNIVLSGIKKDIFKSDQLVVVPHAGSTIYLNGKPYRGTFKFVSSDKGILVLNVLEIEEYLKGVLPSEIGYLAQNQYEAYRAQAIASRSYALSKLKEKVNELYDVKASVMDQVYRGILGEHDIASKAVDETRGLVAVWNGEPIVAYYSSCCGGHTSDIREVWPWKTPFPYLYGVRDTVVETRGRSLCSRSANFRWKVIWSGNRLREILRKTIPSELGERRGSIGRLKDLKILSRSLDGRVKEIEIVTDRKTFRVQGDRIRWVLRPDLSSKKILKSTMFKLDVKKSRGVVLRATAIGGGNGHGVGLCQYGAIRMAELGYSGEEIIEHYYPGVDVVRLYY